MWNNGHDAYLESRVLSASPLELVHMLYQGGAQAVRDARHYLQQGEIAARSEAITKACGILIELHSSLDRERGGEIALGLERLYDYMQARLLQANMEQADAPLAEVLGLLTTLGEAWESVKPVAAAAPAGSAWSQHVTGDMPAALSLSF